MSEYKKISNFGTPDYADEPRYERKNGQWVDTKADIIAELEKIKAEISGRCIFSISKIDVLDIIDNHIKELKGENK